MLFAIILAAQTVAVLEFRDEVPAAQRIDAAFLGDQVRLQIKRALPEAKVITRENMLVLLTSSGKDLADCEGECEVDTGRRIGADLVVSGELLRFGTQYKLNMKLHDTRSGELLSGAVASGATADELDRSLHPAVESLIEPLHPAPAAQAARFAWSAHAAAGYGNASGGPELVTVPIVGNSAAAGAFAFGGGFDAGVRFEGPFSIALFGEYAAVAGDTWVNVFAGGALARAQLGPSLSLALGVGASHMATGVSGWAVLGAADYKVYGPLAIHAGLLIANQVTGNGLFPGGDEVVCATGGASLMY